MTTEVRKSMDGLRVYVDHQPGNMTRYVAMGAQIPGTRQWVVAFPEWRAAYYFSEGSCIGLGYLSEKIGCDRSMVDISEMAKAITMIVPNTTCEAL